MRRAKVMSVTLRKSIQPRAMDGKKQAFDMQQMLALFLRSTAKREVILHRLTCELNK
jgi:hypothetical protein